jgi:hypothetical protein
MTKIRGFYRDENGVVQEMEGTSDEYGVVSFPRVPTAGILVEGVDLSDISPVYMTPPTNPAWAENVLPRITPDMLAVWTRLQEMKATQSARFVVNNTPDLRSDLWHAFIEMMTATMDGGE